MQYALFNCKKLFRKDGDFQFFISNSPKSSYNFIMRFSKGMSGHFIGIGGVGVNALAKFMLDFGISVSGSDEKNNTLCESLTARGAEIFCSEKTLKNDVKNCIKQADFVCFSSAIPKDNCELAYAKSLGKTIFERHELLAEISLLFSKVIAIAGTHGKTTTTAMLVQILLDNKQKFVGMIGGESVDFSNYVNNTFASSFEELKECVFVCEACEYKRNLLSLKPHIAVVTNAELDHPDSYQNMQSVNDAFATFLDKTDTKIIDGEHSYLIGKKRGVKMCGQYVVESYCQDDVSRLKCSFKKDKAVVRIGGNRHKLTLENGGEYNYKNVCFAIAVAVALGLKSEDIIPSLERFKGVKRRFEYVGVLGNAKVYFDFAHHPSEIACVIKKARDMGKLLVIFQPHTYSRTQAYLSDFARSLAQKHNGVDALVLMRVYGAREQKFDGVDSDVLQKEIFDKFRKKDVYLVNSHQSTIDFVISHANEYDVILLLGAGDIYDIKRKLLLKNGNGETL